MSQLFVLPFQVPFQFSAPLGLAKLYFYQAGTEVHQPVYTTAALSVAHDQPVRSDAAGVLPPIFLNPAASFDYRIQLKDENDALVSGGDVDNIPRSGYPTQAEIGLILNPRTDAETAAIVTPTNYAIDTTDYGEVRRYGYIADDSTDNSTALTAAFAVLAQASGLKLRLPPGTARFSTSQDIASHGCIVGAGKERTKLKYTGAAQAFKQATPTARIYEIDMADFSLYNTGTGTVGLDMAAVSTSNFARMWIDGFTTNVRLHSPTSGYSVYNRFYDVTTNNTGATTKGFVLSGTSTNANSFIACRANFASQTATFGWEITDGNGNEIIACHPEGGGTGVYITATAPGLAGGNVVAFSRFEGHALAINVASANVEHTRIIQNHYTLNTADISDSGTRTMIDDPIAARSIRTYPSTVAAHADGTHRLVRDTEGGSSLPFVVLRDSASGGGTPITLQIETERAAGSFFRGKRGGSTYFDVLANGMFYSGPVAVGSLPSAASNTYWRAIVNDANATTYNSVVAAGGANVVPVFSDGTNWRIG